MSRFF